MNLETWLVESYLDGKIKLPRPLLQGLLHVYLHGYNRLQRWTGSVTTLVREETEEIATRSAELMAVHYDQPLEWFAGFLGGSMKYSMGLWETGAGTLEAAQEAMMEDVCRKADIRDGQDILDVGCGFGSLAEYVLRTRPETRVTGLTMSGTQAGYLRSTMEQSGHPLGSDRFRLIQADFNEIGFDHPFDRVVSLGMFEHVGNLGRALRKIRRFTRADGWCFLHYIVYLPRPGLGDYARFDPFMDRYIFPGARIHAHGELLRHQDHFQVVQDWFLNGRNYSRTLKAWLANFLAHFPPDKAHSTSAARERRIWEFYLRGCMALFTLRGGTFYGNGQYLLRPKPSDMEADSRQKD